MQLNSSFSFLEILTFFSVIEMYIKMSENFKFLAFRINFISGHRRTKRGRRGGSCPPPPEEQLIRAILNCIRAIEYCPKIYYGCHRL